MSGVGRQTESESANEDEIEGGELLKELSYKQKVNSSNSYQMRNLLGEWIKGTRFAGVNIEEVTDGMTDVHSNMKATMRNSQEKETFHIWFARKDGKWILKFCQIPQSNT